MFGLFGKTEVKLRTVDVGREFSPVLYRPHKDSPHHRFGTNDSAQDFRERYLKELDCQEAWENDDPVIILNFRNVEKLAPSFAYVAFAYYRKYATTTQILKKIEFTYRTGVQKQVIEIELELYDERLLEINIPM